MSSNVSTRTRGTETLSGYLFPAAMPEPVPKAPGLNILLASRDPGRAALLKKDLTTSGHQVTGLAQSGQDACHLCQTMRPDLALLDLDLPQMDGLQAAYVIKRNQSLPVVLMASRIKPRHREEALKAGVQACLIMPMESALLSRSLQIARHQFLRLRVMQEQADELRHKIKTRKLIGCAAGILMQRHGIAYDQAYKRLHEKARSEMLPLAEIAQNVINAGPVPEERR